MTSLRTSNSSADSCGAHPCIMYHHHHSATDSGLEHGISVTCCGTGKSHSGFGRCHSLLLLLLLRSPPVTAVSAVTDQFAVNSDPKASFFSARSAGHWADGLRWRRRRLPSDAADVDLHQCPAAVPPSRPRPCPSAAVRFMPTVTSTH